jgi:predicted ArsR family transcriptional regulator
MGTLQEQARALGDPTRHDVFRYVADAGRAVDVAELTEHFGLNHNAIRQHLGKLVGAGILMTESARSEGRGRPRLRYVVDPNADSRWGVAGPYERLSLLLTEIVRTGDAPAEVGRRAGAAAARSGGGPGANRIDQFVEEMARQGFEPTARRNGERVELTLRSCPFATTAAADPQTVCELHLGMAHGIAEQVGGVIVDELTAMDPHRGHCHLRCHVEDPNGEQQSETSKVNFSHLRSA